MFEGVVFFCLEQIFTFNQLLYAEAQSRKSYSVENLEIMYL